MYGTAHITSIARIADWAINWLLLAWVLWLSGRAIIRWIRCGRIEIYSESALTPQWFRRFLGNSESRPPTERAKAVVVTRLGWIVICCVTVWWITKAF